MQIRQERRIQKKREEHQKQLEAIEKAKLKKAAKLEKIRQEKEKEKVELNTLYDSFRSEGGGEIIKYLAYM